MHSKLAHLSGDFTPSATSLCGIPLMHSLRLSCFQFRIGEPKRYFNLDTSCQILDTILVGDFSYLKDLASGKWVILAPRRSERPKESENSEPICPFESGDQKPIFEQGEVRVYRNIYPFAPVHEMIVHSLDHAKDFDELSEAGVREVFKVFQKKIFGVYRQWTSLYF